MAENLDLLGDPIPENFGGRGRPPHIPTTTNRNKVMILLAMDWDEVRIAKAIGITKPTLKKHYFRELKVREEARARLEAQLLVGMAAKALTGDVPAFREIDKRFARADLAGADEAYRPTALPAPKAEKIGKKAQRQADAELLAEGTLAPGAPPARLVN